jgi:hypothetical protein
MLQSLGREKIVSKFWKLFFTSLIIHCPLVLTDDRIIRHSIGELAPDLGVQLFLQVLFRPEPQGVSSQF